jgi:hypothetical protein
MEHKTKAEAIGGHAAPAPRSAIPPGAIAYEKTDVDVGSIARIAIVLAVVVAGTLGIAFGVFRLLGARAERGDPPPPPLSRPAEDRRAPEPRLQTAPAADLAALQDEERRVLGGYGWADETGGMAHIPIEEAMALYVAGMRAPGVAPVAAPSTSPGAAAPPAAPGRR